MTQKFGNLDITTLDEGVPRTVLPKLTPTQVKQLDWLVKEYPDLDTMIIESILRITPAQRDKIVDEIKDGTLKHEEPLPSEECIQIAVKVE